MNWLTFYIRRKSLNTATSFFYGLYIELGVQYNVNHKILNKFNKLHAILFLECKTTYYPYIPIKQPYHPKTG